MSIDNTLSIDSKIVADQRQISAQLAGETVILDTKSEQYFGLNHVGANIWALIEQPKTIAEIRDAIAEKYQIEPGQCEEDILGLLQEMVDESLIEVCHEMAV